MPNSCEESHHLMSQILQYPLLGPTRIHSDYCCKTRSLTSN